MNSDTILLNNAVKYFFDFWNDNFMKENIGALGAWLIGKNSEIVHSWGEYPTFNSCKYYFMRLSISIFLRKFIIFKRGKERIQKQIDKKKLLEINGYVTGADLFLLNNDDAYFDEDYFMYFEETDLQLNHFTKKGKKIFIIPGPEIIHLEGGSDKNLVMKSYDFKKKSSIYYWESCIKYLKKNGLASCNELLKFQNKIKRRQGSGFLAK